MSESLLDKDNINKILNSDLSLDILLERLKKSINTGEEFSKYIKKKAIIEDDHYSQLKKFGSQFRASLKNPSKLKSDSFSNRLDQIIEFDEKSYNVGSSYVTALNVMYDELSSLIVTMGRSRKQIKEEGKRKEKECQDSITAAEKAKQKYYHLCDDLDKLKNGDPSKKSFSLTNKSAEQQEDDLQRKVDLADQDYKSKVSICKKLKDEILMVYRPNHSKKLKNLILEMDIAMNVQLQKLATWNETLIMNSGVLISPLTNDKSSMKTLASSIDNEQDLFNYLVKFEKEVNSNRSTLVPVEYKVHPSLVKYQPKSTKPFLNNNIKDNGYSSTTTTTTSSQPVPSQTHDSGNRNLSGNGSDNLNISQNSDKRISSYNSPQPDPQPSFYGSLDPSSQPNTPDLNGAKSLNQYSQPTFGVSIEDLIQFAGIDNVPLIVKKCIEVIETHGLDLEGIYRKSGNVTIVQSLKESIDSKFTNYLMIGNNIDPTNVIDTDIYCIASLLKLYFSSLPEPLLTEEYYQSFIETVKSLDENYIAKKLHHLVYNLPDGSYFTLRSLIFHLNKVSSKSDVNKMSVKNLAIIWGPVILNDNSMNPHDLSYKSKVVEELMFIANEIFDADD
ncbi:RHO GTPase-activating protein Rgd1p [[Candida] jaroonii]|uniref:RHO GTPase-activating protein Rgd1p n=1 Tax=[Candida] jaroonii TaxID=467808 RepID=A0ACA9Y2R8_9ASCO|nr:RHO GTPase-activating protein Rgd1p [[Candida] jaroonii]